MSIFDNLGKGKPQQNNFPDKAQMQQLASQLQGDPVGFLQKMGYNIPAGLDVRNPNAIINYLMQSKQINGGLLGMAQQLMGMFK